jgi:PAS domain S-box-containing protein
VYVDLERGCTFVNNVFLATRGFTREFALGKFPPDVYPAEVMVELQPHLDRAVAGEESTYERLLRLPSGDERWVRVRITPRRDDDRKVVGYYVVSTDINETARTLRWFESGSCAGDRLDPRRWCIATPWAATAREPHSRLRRLAGRR